MKKKDILRILDANLNRLREALRVCEEITRFVIEDENLTAKLKKIRHDVSKVISESSNIEYSSLILSRDSQNDVGRTTIPQELKRNGVGDVLSANLQRAKESIRALEEFSKVIDKKLAAEFKNIRFKVYDSERALIEKCGICR